MHGFRTVPAAVLAIIAATAFATGSMAATPSGPTVYQDDYVTVRSAISEAGMQPLHIGDALSLSIDVAFDARQVQIENLGDDLFQRAFAGMPAIRLYEPASVTTHTGSGDRVRVTGRWRLQILGCPGDTPSCPGNKSYELPVMTVSYQLRDGASGSTDSRSARFRPWPGTIDVGAAIPVLPGPGTELTDVLPGGAYPLPESGATPTSAGSLLLAAGALLLAGGYLAALRQRHPDRITVRSHHADTRFERALTRLRDDTLRDDEWSDLLRRCLTWYCVDELGRNPYTWLGATASDAAVTDQETTGAQRFFLEVLQQESIDADKRRDYVDRLLELTSRSQHRGTPGQSA